MDEAINRMIDKVRDAIEEAQQAIPKGEETYIPPIVPEDGYYPSEESRELLSRIHRVLDTAIAGGYVSWDDLLETIRYLAEVQER